MEMIVPALGGRKLFRVNDQMIISPTWLLLSICGLLMATKCRIFLWEEDRNQRFLSRSCTLTTFACLTWLTLLGRWLVLSSHAVVYCPLISFWHNKCPAIPSETTVQSGYEMLSDLIGWMEMNGYRTDLSFFDTVVDGVQQISSILVTLGKFSQFFPDQFPFVIAHHPFKCWIHVLWNNHKTVRVK